MIKKSTLLHLRIPFSFFLLPIFLFAMATAGFRMDYNSWLVFAILHLLLYPASNGFNSYYDKDEKSIGGLQNPPPVSRQLLIYSLLLDLMAILLALSLDFGFALMIFGYGLVSKAYSHPSIRLKKYPVLGWLTIGIFQGLFTFLMVIKGLSEIDWRGLEDYFIPAILSTTLLLGSYPMTQVYQHQDDRQRGDLTISLKLGILGTFHFTALFFTLSVGLFIFYFLNYYSLQMAILFPVLLSPTLFYFIFWYLKVRKQPAEANYKNTMRLNFISSLCLNIFFVILIYSHSNA
ncbi:MAG: ubiquinone biosynthesis protein UbiA [Bacteroidetes bacterium]|nr:MAG: ubiquinone biosynthesis protein UbiA [Bacteroidota bacterium]